MKVPDNYIYVPRDINHTPYGVHSIVKRLPEGNYKLVVLPDLGELYIAPATTRLRGIVILSKFTFTEKVKSMDLHNTLREIIRGYNSSVLVTYTRACKEYGKKNVTDDSLIMECENPYSKYAANMRLYDRKMIEYRMKAV